MTRARLFACASLAIVVPAGFGLKFYPGPGHAWVNNSLGGVAYEIFWCLVLFALWPRRSAINRIVLGVLVGTCALEALQLWSPPLLHRVRGTFLGRTLIGTTFVWTDFIYYLIGCVLGLLWLRGLSRPAAPAASNEAAPPSGSAGRTS